MLKPAMSNDVFKTDLFVTENHRVVINDFILAVCNGIQDKFPGKEFSILVKGKWTESGFICSDDYIIPNQKVSTTSIEYEPLGAYVQRGYNVVVHSHHDMACGFSSTDYEYINSFFPVSILYANRKFSMAQTLFRVDGGYVRYDIPISIRNVMRVDPIGITNIISESSYIEKICEVVFGDGYKTNP